MYCKIDKALVSLETRNYFKFIGGFFSFALVRKSHKKQSEYYQHI